MIYYRLAFLNDQDANWQWKSPLLSSLDEVVMFLKADSAFPQSLLRVFSAPSEIEMEVQLQAENRGWNSLSMPAAQFLREHLKHQKPEQQIQKSEQNTVVSSRPSRSTSPSRQELILAAFFGTSAEEIRVDTAKKPGAVNSLDRKRLEIEMGAGGDHDTPYLFSLPQSLPQLLTWLRLQACAQKEEDAFL